MKYKYMYEGGSTVEHASQHAEQATTVGDKCSLAIFFDNHQDLANEIVMAGILDQLKDKGFNTLCIEAENTKTWSEYLEVLQKKLSTVQALKEQYKDNKIINRYFKLHLPLIELLTQSKAHNFNFIAIDMTASEKQQNELKARYDPTLNFDNMRHQTMAHFIDTACQKYGGKIVALVGLAHGEIQNLLVQKGYKDIKSFWVLNEEVDTELEQLLLTKTTLDNGYEKYSYKLGLNIIDLRSNYSDLKKLEEQLGLATDSFTKLDFEAIYNKLFLNSESSQSSPK